MMRFLKIFILIWLVGIPAMMMAVTEKEMEEARTIATKSYLRYANDGSGYLDDISPKTMEELEKQLKPKEKENIKAFKAIAVPSDYASWDKEKLVEFWAVTAFQSKGLLEKGRGGRIRTRSQINKMNIGAPVAESQEVKTAADSKPGESPEGKVSESAKNQAGIQTDSLPGAAQILADEAIVDKEIASGDQEVKKAYNYTWVYIMALCILVGVVIALVVYAANVMKKNSNPASAASSSNAEREAVEYYESKLDDKDAEIAMLHKKLETARRQNSELKAKLDEMAAELHSRNNRPAGEAVTAPVVTSGPAKGEAAPEERKTWVRSIYLGRANSKGIFVRADRKFKPGQSVFLLETSDGYSGTFRVADNRDAWNLSLSDPQEYLEGACSGKYLEETTGVTRVVTEVPGTAIFEGGCWRVARKARIRYS